MDPGVTVKQLNYRGGICAPQIRKFMLSPTTSLAHVALWWEKLFHDSSNYVAFGKTLLLIKISISVIRLFPLKFKVRGSSAGIFF